MKIPARDGYELGATLYEAASPVGTIVINSAAAVPRRYYRHFATHAAEQGFHVVTYDYRGIGDSRPASLKNFPARMRDWALQDMSGVVDWVLQSLPQPLYFVGHSFGGQTAGLLEQGHHVAAMATFSSQSGYWKLQGGMQKLSVGFHMYVTFPVLVPLLGYLPWSRFGASDDLPAGVALEWASWCRSPGYLLDDRTLPLERYQGFTAPVLAYSFEDDAWGTAAAVDAMMARAYPRVERRHVVPREHGLRKIGHFGFFRPEASGLWQETLDFLRRSRG